MKRSSARVGLVVALGLGGLALAGPSETPEPARAQAPPAAVTIDAPADGAVTGARSVVVTGRAPAPPKGGDVEVTVTVGGRPVSVAVQGTAYRTPVALTVGRNDVVARADVYATNDDDIAGANDGQPRSRTTARSTVTRTVSAGDETGSLDLATAYTVADYDDAVYWLCGEGDCGTDVRCFQVSPRRVDCPVGSYGDGSLVRRCGVVITVRLRGARLYAGNYRCKGRLTPRPQRFVRRAVWRKGRRFRVAATGDTDYLREEINRPNRYGVTRFDVDRDVFLP
jgi:hypothetical protein